MKKIIVLTILLFALTAKVDACDVNSPKQTNIAISSDYQEQIFYDSLKVLNSSPFTTINNCTLTAAKRRFLMLAIGIEKLNLNNKNISYSIADRERENKCKIVNSDLESPFTSKQQHEELMLKRNFINKCIVVKATDFGPQGLQLPEEQPGCSVTRVSDNSVNFTGSFCYIKPGFNSNISVELEVKPECLTVEGLKKNNITGKDFNGILNFYTSDVSDGRNNDLQALGGLDLRFSVNPISEVVKPADDFGVRRPVFPSTYKVKEIYLGEPELKARGRDLQFKFPFVVDTRCERKCSGGFCSSSCDYAMPIIGEHTLEVFEDGKWHYLTSWYDGAVAQGQWQGILYGLGKGVQKGALTDDAEYRVTIKFREPNFDFKYFDGDITRRLFLNNNNIGTISRRGRIGTIPLLRTIVNSAEIPPIETIQELDFDGSLDGVQRSLISLQSYLKNKFWPPLYENVCTGKNNCVENGTQFLELRANFKLVKNGRKYSMENIRFSRESISGKNYSNRVMTKFPEIECGK